MAYTATEIEAMFRHYGHRREIETLSSPLGRHFGKFCHFKLQVLLFFAPCPLKLFQFIDIVVRRVKYFRRGLRLRQLAAADHWQGWGRPVWPAWKEVQNWFDFVLCHKTIILVWRGKVVSSMQMFKLSYSLPREAHWQRELCTVGSQGLNSREERGWAGSGLSGTWGQQFQGIWAHWAEFEGILWNMSKLENFTLVPPKLSHVIKLT